MATLPEISERERYRNLEDALHALRRAAEENGLGELMVKQSVRHRGEDGWLVADAVVGMEISVTFQRPLEIKR